MVTDLMCKSHTKHKSYFYMQSIIKSFCIGAMWNLYEWWWLTSSNSTQLQHYRSLLPLLITHLLEILHPLLSLARLPALQRFCTERHNDLVKGQLPRFKNKVDMWQGRQRSPGIAFCLLQKLAFVLICIYSRERERRHFDGEKFNSAL